MRRSPVPILLAAVLLAGCGVSETVAQNNRAVAEWAIGLGGTVTVHDSDRELKSLGELPPESFRLRRINLNQTRVGDKELQNLTGVGSLEYLGLYGTKITDKSLDHIATLDSLKELELSNTTVSDRGIEKLAALKGLKKLYLNGTSATDEGVKRLREKLPGCKVIHIR